MSELAVGDQVTVDLSTGAQVPGRVEAIEGDNVKVRLGEIGALYYLPRKRSQVHPAGKAKRGNP